MLYLSWRNTSSPVSSLARLSKSNDCRCLDIILFGGQYHASFVSMALWHDFRSVMVMPPVVAFAQECFGYPWSFVFPMFEDLSSSVSAKNGITVMSKCLHVLELLNLVELAILGNVNETSHRHSTPQLTKCVVSTWTLWFLWKVIHKYRYYANTTLRKELGFTSSIVKTLVLRPTI